MGLEFLIISWLLSKYIVKNFWQDGIAAWRGEDPPSFRREQERWKAKQEAGSTEPGPGRRYFANAWADAIETAEEKRARRRKHRTEERHARWADEDGTRPNHKERRPDRGATEVGEPVAEPEQATDGRCFYCRLATATTDSPDVLGEPQPACAACATARERTHRDDKPGPEAEVEPKTEPGEEPEPADEPVIEPAAEDEEPTYRTVNPDTAEDHPGGTVIAFPIAFPTMNTTQEEHVSAEIAGLRAAITYTADSADQATKAAQGIELALSGLAAGKTTGTAIDALHGAREALNLAAEWFLASNAELVRHLSVAESYAANQGAGSKEFVTNN